MKFIDKFHQLLVRMNDLKKKYLVISNLKSSIDIATVIRFEDSGTLKAININQYCIIEVCNILSWVTL